MTPLLTPQHNLYRKIFYSCEITVTIQFPKKRLISHLLLTWLVKKQSQVYPEP